MSDPSDATPGIFRCHATLRLERSMDSLPLSLSLALVPCLSLSLSLGFRFSPSRASSHFISCALPMSDLEVPHHLK